MKLRIQAKLEDTNLGAQFDIELPQKYANVVHKGTEILNVVTQAVERIKEELERDNGRD